MSDPSDFIPSEMGGSLDDWSQASNLFDDGSGSGGGDGGGGGGGAAPQGFRGRVRYRGPSMNTGGVDVDVGSGDNLGTDPSVSSRSQNMGNGGGYPQTVASILDQVENAIGKRISARAVRAAAHRYGAEATANLFGLGMEDVGFLLATQPQRRSRGISARQLKNAGRTLRQFAGFKHQLDKYVGRAGFTRREHHHAHSGKKK